MVVCRVSSIRCLEVICVVVWKVSGRYLGSVWKASGSCLECEEGVWKKPQGALKVLEGIWNAWNASILFPNYWDYILFRPHNFLCKLFLTFWMQNIS